MSEERLVSLKPVLATAENIAPFGELLAMPAKNQRRGTQFYGDAVQLWSTGGFRSDDDTMMSLARVSPREPRVTWMERHFKHTQTFIPLGGKPFIMVLAPPGEGDLPNPDDVRAMQFDGQAGFMMHLKTWHEFPFAIQANTDVIVVLRNETMSDLQQLEDDEAVGDDLEKRHMGKRLGVRFEFEMP